MNTPRYIRHLLVLLALCLVVVLGVRIYTFRSNPPAQDEDTVSVSADKDLELRDVTFTESEDGVPVWSLRAERADYTRNGQVADFQVIEVTFFSSEKEERARLTANSALADLSTHELTARGDVKLHTVDGGRLSTEVLNYRYQDKLLWTDRSVLFERHGVHIEGLGMTYDLEQKLLDLESSVSAYVPFR
ncbi:MAG: LPS export ABC transporter periplasmic protein LptC [Desulfuromonas sp.]|nr:MAG: LPS export ABC transporter periplasmic protein LptC [Desulfuromonas sp.]